MMKKNDHFKKVDYEEPHRLRNQMIVRRHPEVRQLFGRNPSSALIVLLLVALQIGLARTFGKAPLWQVLVAAWFVGAFINHALWVLIHECTHNLLFRKKSFNQWVAIFANLPFVVPSAESFRIYHLKHHQHQGDYNLDADLATEWEAKLVGGSMLGKFVWELFFPLFHSLRTIRFSRIGNISFFTPMTLANLAVQGLFDILVFLYLGPGALVYLLASLFFSIGLHPLGARWIQEHYIMKEGQETYSYYGALNRVALNVGYHNEHHDFPFVSWNRLPKIRAIAPEFYDTLYSHSSWLRLWCRFLTDPKITLFSRITRQGVSK